MNICSKKLHSIFNTKKHKDLKDFSDLCKNITLLELIRLMPNGSHQASKNCWLHVKHIKEQVTIESTSGKNISNPKLCLPATIVVDSEGFRTAAKNANKSRLVFIRSEINNGFNKENRSEYRDVKKVIQNAIMSCGKDLIKRKELINVRDQILKERAES